MTNVVGKKKLLLKHKNLCKVRQSFLLSRVERLSRDADTTDNARRRLPLVLTINGLRNTNLS